jgi:CheY-like chemotaxis protein
MRDFLRQSVGATISVKIDISPDVQPVKIDANQLELALMNLAVNARDAMPTGGSLTITCRNETITPDSNVTKSLSPGQYVRIDVADTGEGMSEATLAKAMEPFFTTKGIGKGTGLGLSVVQGLMAQSNGAMDISSRVGKGTVVTLLLPNSPPEDVVRQAALPPPAVNVLRRKLQILLVDDDALVSMNTADMLMDLGHNVSEASSGLDALRKLKSNGRFDVVVTDYAMPGMNGLELAMEIRRIKSKLPIILATGYAELPPDVPLEFPRLGKPYTQEDLAKALETVVAFENSIRGE